MSTPEAPTNETVIGQIRLSGLFAGRYQIIKELAKGGMGIVYKAHDNVLDKTVALKFILYTDWTEDQLLRFQREAQASSRLLHPNIAVVYNFGLNESNTPYMVLEYVEGKTIKRIVNKRKFDILQTLQIGQQLCAALHHAHLNGLVHRDIKSSNVILDESQDPPIAKIIDFGIARVIDTHTFRGTLSSDQVVPGSPPYMAPEQVKRQPMDHRCDIYSLGCVFFEMLTGETPFRGDTAIETMEMHVSKQPPLLQSINRSIDYPEELEGLVAKCLAKKPEDRFQSAEDLKEALKKFQEEYQDALKKQQLFADDENIARDQGPSQGEILAQKRRKKRIVITAATTVALIAIGVGVYLFSTDVTVDGIRTEDIHTDPKKRKKVRRTYTNFYDDVSDKILNADLERYKKNPKEVLIRYQAGDNALTEEFLNELAKLPVESLEIFYSEMPPNGMEIISRIKTVRLLKLLQTTNVNDETLKNLANLPNLTELSISDHKDLKGTVFDDLQSLPIRRLNIRDCPSIATKQLEVLSKWPQLNCLDLQENDLNPADMKALKKIANLRILILNNSTVQPGALEVLPQLKSLETLYLANTAIRDKDLDIIAAIKGLLQLDISGCRLSDHALARFKQRLPNCEFVQSQEGANVKQLKKWVPDNLL